VKKNQQKGGKRGKLREQIGRGAHKMPKKKKKKRKKSGGAVRTESMDVYLRGTHPPRENAREEVD